MSGETHGVEVASTWNALAWWRWRADYSLLLMHMRLDPDSTDTTGRVAQTDGSSPRHHRQPAILDGSARSYRDRSRLLRYTDVLSQYARSSTPAYWELDMRVSWHATPRLELSLVGQNLLQYHHPEEDPTQQMLRGFYGQARWTW